MTALTAFTIFQCSPIHKIYNRDSEGTCLSALTLWRVNAIYNIISDIIIIMAPFPVIRSLGLPTAHFIGIALILCCGLFVILTAILRYTTLSTAGHADDPTAGTLHSTVWTQAEASVAVVCACLPMLRVLLQRFFPCLRSATRSTVTSDDGAELRRYEERIGSTDSNLPLPHVPLPAPHQLPGGIHTAKLSSRGTGGTRGLIIYPRSAAVH